MFNFDCLQEVPALLMSFTAGIFSASTWRPSVITGKTVQMGVMKHNVVSVFLMCVGPLYTWYFSKCYEHKNPQPYNSGEREMTAISLSVRVKTNYSLSRWKMKKYFFVVVLLLKMWLAQWSYGMTSALAWQTWWVWIPPEWYTCKTFTYLLYLLTFSGKYWMYSV